MKTPPLGSLIFLLSLALVPMTARAQKYQTIPVPTPVPQAQPSTTPLPYPAYGTPAPDVQQLVPHAGIPTTVSLTQAVDIAVAVSPTLATERAIYYQLRANYTAEQQRLFPAVSASGQWQKSYGGFNSGALGFSSRILTTEEGSYSVSELVFDGGRVITAIKEAKQSELSGQGTLLREFDTLGYDVAQAYYVVLEDQALVSADAQLVREFTTSEDSVRAQIRNGVAALSDLASAEYNTAKARGTLISAQGALISAQSAFATELGLDANTQIVPQQLGPDTYTQTPTYAKSLAQALLMRPDYLAAQYTVSADRDNLHYAELARSPSITATWNQGDERQFPAIPPPAGTNGAWIQSRSLGASISIPIYDQGVTWYNIEVAKYALDEANAALEGTRLGVESDVRSALAQLISARAAFVQARSELSSAQVSMQAAQASYKVGVNTILDLVTAEANLATAQSDYIAALYGVRLAEQTYLYATGMSDLHL
jgi:outer membrane protein